MSDPTRKILKSSLSGLVSGFVVSNDDAVILEEGDDERDDNYGDDEVDKDMSKDDRNATAARKITLEALLTGRQKRREKLLKELRESAAKLSDAGRFSQMEALVRDDVSIKS